jgi:aminobenzoyl-glutamate transport protein
MSQPVEAPKPEAPKGVMQRVLDMVERVGNKIPHPVLIFLILIAIVLVLSHALYLLGASVSFEVMVPSTHPVEAPAPGDLSSYDDTGTATVYRVIDGKKYKIETVTTAARSLLSAAGIRHIYSRLVPNFMGFMAVGLLIVAMIGVGVAEESGLVKALIRKLVVVSPAWALTYILAFVGILSSIASDAGYLVLIPLAGTAFLSLGRHPLAGLALGFAAVAGAFNVNIIPKPLDAVLTEFTNNAIPAGERDRLSIVLTANLWFSLASVAVLTVVIAFVSERIIEPRLGKYQAEQPSEEGAALSAEESRGLRFAGLALLGVLVFFGLLTIPPGAPLRNPDTGELIGNSPFMNGLIVFIMLVFLAAGIAYGKGAGTIKTSADVIGASTKAVSGLGGTILLFVVISQFVDYFNYSNIPTLMAIAMSNVLQAARDYPLLLLVGFIVVVTILNLFFTPAIAKWAIFAPVFVPIFVTLSIDPAAVLAAYRVGDSPTNAITPLNAYFALVVGFAQKYDPNVGIGTIIALMLPYVIWMAVIWTLLFVAWFLLGLPWGI